MRFLITAPILALLLVSCSSTPDQKKDDSKSEKTNIMSSGVQMGGQVVKETTDGFSDAATAPLEDLNLKRKKIPGVIRNYVSPYDPVDNASCQSIADEVVRLNTVLAKDFDVQIDELLKSEKKKSKNNLSSKASGFALNTIASEARGFIPFRGLVRQATGANAHQKKVDDAFQRAYLRRAFLKGVGLGKGCDVPASPIPYRMEDFETLAPQISYKKDDPEN